MAKYWNEKGAYQALVTPLQALIPAMGEVPQGKKQNKHLERFRKAQNCYYDLYNNGLCNRAGEFRSVFGFSAVRYKIDDRSLGRFRESLYGATEQRMDEIIYAAAIEQGFALHLETAI